jgi:hypothetical protein
MQRVRSAASQNRDPGFLRAASNRDPGSAAHRSARATRCAAAGARKFVQTVVHELVNVYLSPSPKPRLSCPCPVQWGRFLEAILSADRARAGRTGAPGRPTGWWPRWSAGRRCVLRHWARAAGVISCARRSDFFASGVCRLRILAPPAAPPPRARSARDFASLGRMAPRECGGLAV